MKIINDFAVELDGGHVIKLSTSSGITIRLKESSFKNLALLDEGAKTETAMPDGDLVTVEVLADGMILITAINDFEQTGKEMSVHRNDVRQIMKFVAEAEIAEENIDRLKEVKKSLVHSPSFGRRIDGEIKYLKDKFSLN